MKKFSMFVPKEPVLLLTACVFLLLSLTACSNHGQENIQDIRENASEPDISRFIVAIEDEPDTVDFQCTTIHYTVAINVFNRLAEMISDDNGNIIIEPSLAESWEVSEDGRTYTFHLRDNVKFSNGSPLTSSDVLYTLTRLLTHPGSSNRDIADEIVGAEMLENGETDRLAGFQILSDLDFAITLEQPFEAFLACLTMPGASILDEETTVLAGDRFGIEPEWTVGTGSFILWKWEPGEGILLKANPDCWAGAPKSDGLDLRFMTDSEEIRMMFENGEIDVLDLDELNNFAEYFIHGDIYQDRLYQTRRMGTVYIALNESVEPLNDVRVRKALQMALNRRVMLDAVYSGRGSVVNGIYSHGLYGFNPDLPEIPFDPERSRELLAEAGYPDGFSLTVSVKSSSTKWELTLMRVAVSMWEKIGIDAAIEILSESDFMDRRKNGQLACYTAEWTADYNDPDNYIYTFFGNWENTVFRSLCYPNEEIMERVREARTIGDSDQRIREYRDLEQIIIQEDAAWIPLFSRLRYYVVSERLEGMSSAWNGSVKNVYSKMSVKETK